MNKKRHLLLLGGWIIYFAFYFITENFIPENRLHVIHCALDDIIPFNEYFLVFYAGWYFLIAGALLYTLLYNVDSFKKLQIYIMISQMLATIVYIVYPSVQFLRPAVFPRNNIFTWLLGLIYKFDTNTGVFPSLHVALSLALVSVALKDKDLAAGIKVLICIVAILICMSVCFVKQHSVLDVLAALPVALAAEIIVYGRDYWLVRLKRKDKGYQHE